jgi:hypothetical protein
MTLGSSLLGGPFPTQKVLTLVFRGRIVEVALVQKHMHVRAYAHPK